MILFSAFLVALVVTMALIPPLMRVAERLSVVDTPNERKVHTGAIPRIGGMAMVVGACVPIILWLPHNTTVMAFLSALLILLVFGAWDDSKELDYRLKFLGQFLAVFVIIFWGKVSIAVLPFAGMDPVPVWLSIPVTVFFLVGVTNAVNLSDGLDGLAAGVTLLSLGAIALLAKLADDHEIITTCFVIAGTIFGFLRYNTYPARIFMGDTGSQFLGFTVGVLAVMLTQQVNTALNPWLPLFLVGLPIVDTLFVMTKRISEGRSPFAADKGHMHHRLLSMGLAHYEAVSVIYVTQLAFLLAAFLLALPGGCGRIVGVSWADRAFPGWASACAVQQARRRMGVALPGMLSGWTTVRRFGAGLLLAYNAACRRIFWRGRCCCPECRRILLLAH